MHRPSPSHGVLACVALTLIQLTQACGDTWGPPRKEHSSANNRWSLKVDWGEGHWGGKGTLSLWEKTKDGLKLYWKRGYVHGENPPSLAYVADTGKYVVLQDMHARLGYGKVIVVLGKDGNVLGSFELGDFLSDDEIQSAVRSTSSIWWSTNAWGSFIDNDRQFAIITQYGTVCCFDLPTGTLFELTTDLRDEIVDLMQDDAETLVESESTYDRIRGVTLLGGMRIEEAIPAAKRLFQDKTVTGHVGASKTNRPEVYGVQEAAASALIRLMGVGAIPIIEEELAKANPYMKRELLQVLDRLDSKRHKIVETPHSASIMRMWQRLAEHPSEQIRDHALEQVLRRDDGTYFLENPGLLAAKNVSVLWAAERILLDMEHADRLSFLQKAITDKRGDVRCAALRLLVRYQRSGIEDLLLPLLEDTHLPIRFEVICELACRDNPAAIRKLQGVIATWPHVNTDDPKSFQRMEVETLCKLIRDLKLREVKEDLARIRPVVEQSTAISVNGALAALGVEEALDRLHDLTEKSDAETRALAIQMCRHLTDEKSVALVRQAAASDDSELHDAATKDVRRFDRLRVMGRFERRDK